MHPILFEVAGITIYAYGFMIALGAIAGVAYMAVQGKKELGLTFDQVNNLFLIIFAAAFIGGKVFLFFEKPSYYAEDFRRLLTGSGFVFYGSFLFAVPSMLWYFNKHKIPIRQMLDIMAITTCLVHMFGRVGCFLAGCCYGLPSSGISVTFTHEACKAPLNTPLHPTQLYEAGFIFIVMIALLIVKKSYQQFRGQLFLLYVMAYAMGRSVLEIFRGDSVRGFVIEDILSHSQFIAILIVGVALYFYLRWAKTRGIEK